MSLFVELNPKAFSELLLEVLVQHFAETNPQPFNSLSPEIVTEVSVEKQT
jgi:hypothetical protein